VSTDIGDDRGDTPIGRSVARALRRKQRLDCPPICRVNNPQQDAPCTARAEARALRPTRSRSYGYPRVFRPVLSPLRTIVPSRHCPFAPDAL
jgi:hypothetical protein